MREFFGKIRPYVNMMRLKEQGTILVAFFFGALDAGFLNLGVLLPAAMGFYLISTASFVVNELIDAQDTDKFAQREHSFGKIAVNKKVVLILWFTTALIGMLILFKFGLYWQAITSAILGFFYSWPPIRFKARFILDQISLFLYFVAIPYSAAFFWQNRWPEMSVIPFLSLTAFFVIAQGIHFLGDLEADRKADLKSTPVLLGYEKLLKLLIINAFLALGGFLYLFYNHTHFWYYPLIFFSAMAILALGYARGNIYNPEKLAIRFSWATKVAVALSNYLFLYQILIIYLMGK